MSNTETGAPEDGSERPGADDSEGKSFFGRIFGSWSGPEDEAEDDTIAGEVTDHAETGPGLINLRRKRLSDVAIPRVDIVSMPITVSRDELAEKFRESGLTRIPVYDGTLDHPRGMIHLKDFALRHGFGAEKDFDAEALMRPLIYAPGSMSVGVLLQRMQSERTHMALVIDEYGGVDGLVTIEDLIEQVIGEIEDEHDEEEADLFSEEKPGIWIAMAHTPLEEFEEALGRQIEDEDVEDGADTLGGVVVTLTGRVPARGEVIPHPSGMEFEVVDADPRRLKRIRVRLPSGG
ncbi:transporter associated domain-containing protein [Palleronia caenipelagi]|uniref:CBS domain-containing protein n=1 Tax=Palleronia caenipelagi TaxID=2489174 RepID=A0A547PR94_9RHOB|nr:transporter associated domain-containing protein [Palleronia caenipelagi]TRD16663.1 CBS domain-containing protein [Palleronia caenipelagi]